MTTWKLSAGTAGIIGRKTLKSEALPTTAYIMLGKNCRNNCRFCTQARDSSARSDSLSRVTWPAFNAEAVAPDIVRALAERKIKRVCLQVVNNEDSWSNTLESIAVLTKDGPKPICVANYFTSVDQARELLTAGAERICLALDAATPKLYRKIKGGEWEACWTLLTACAKALPGKMNTHLIVGLGETEEEMVDRLALCLEQGITVGLFAFTPVRGTAMAKEKSPLISHYRRIQIAHHLLRLGYGRRTILCTDGVITGYDINNWQDLLKNGKAFQTSGCQDCNRPFYNERPGSVYYNYPRPLTGAEIITALNISKIGGLGNGVANA